MTLDERSFSDAGQTVELSPTPATSLAVVIDSVVVPDPTIGPALAAVGFAEVDVGLGPTVEVVRVPTDVVDALADAPQTPVSYVFTRLRTRPTRPLARRSRTDDGPRVRRARRSPASVAGASPCASTNGRPTTCSPPCSGSPARGLDPADRRGRGRRLGGRRRRSGDGVDHTVRRPPSAPASPCRRAGPLTALDADPARRRLLADHRPPAVSAGDAAVDVAVPPPDGAGRSRSSCPRRSIGDDVTVRDHRPSTPGPTLDRRYAEPVTLPAAISRAVRRRPHGRARRRRHRLPRRPR